MHVDVEAAQLSNALHRGGLGCAHDACAGLLEQVHEGVASP